MKKVYIAHPLRGGTLDIQVVYKNLAEIEKLLQLLSAKHEYDDILFLSPLHAFSFVSPLGPQDWVLGQCRAMLDLCDELWAFGNWEDSEGCRMEVEYARKLGLTVVFEDALGQEASA